MARQKLDLEKLSNALRRLRKQELKVLPCAVAGDRWRPKPQGGES